ncbi:binding-protein-dependent transport systems inner membrane component [Halomonas sp. GFAJ-1]|nr:binding-protein-dependent transport systems inner membrane component [Halomonas sp. GFAJ-1]
MQDVMPPGDNPFYTALTLILGMDHGLFSIVLLSLKVSLFAVIIASLLALPLGAALALWRFPGRNALIVLLNALMGLPPVVAGLCVYLLLSRAGPLGQFGLLFTPTAMVIAQVILVFPIIAALTRQQVEALHGEYAEQLSSLGLSQLRMMPTLLWDARFGLLTVILAGFGRASAEVGAVMIVGGNIDGVTRVMTTSIVLETSKGNLAQALGLGIVLLTLVTLINAVAHLVSETAKRRLG